MYLGNREPETCTWEQGTRDMYLGNGDMYLGNGDLYQESGNMYQESGNMYQDSGFRTCTRIQDIRE